MVAGNHVFPDWFRLWGIISLWFSCLYFHPLYTSSGDCHLTLMSPVCALPYTVCLLLVLYFLSSATSEVIWRGVGRGSVCLWALQSKQTDRWTVPATHRGDKRIELRDAAVCLPIRETEPILQTSEGIKGPSGKAHSSSVPLKQRTGGTCVRQSSYLTPVIGLGLSLAVRAPCKPCTELQTGSRWGCPPQSCTRWQRWPTRTALSGVHAPWPSG